MSRSGILLAAAALLPLLPLPAQAQSAGPAPVLNVGTSDYAISRKLDLSIGRSLVVELPRDAKEVFVANPKVANAVVRTARKLFIIGIADGATSMFVMDAEGRQITALEINVGRDLNVLRQTLRTALPNSQIEIKPAGESILLIGTVPNASEATQAVDIANAFVGVSDKTSAKGSVINSLTIRDRDQVMVKVVISEVQRKAIKQLGINSTGEWKLGKFSITPSIDNPLPLQPQALSATAIGAGIGNSQNFTLRALERAGLARVLAEPTVTAISGETAKFTAGGEIPVPKGQTCSYDTFGRQTCQVQLEYKPIGVTLNFTPIVLSDAKISMRIATEVTELDFENQFRLSDNSQAGLNTPAFRVRKSDTTVELPSGGTLATAGLIQRVSKSSLNGLPGLMNLPIIGTLFRSRDYQREETELMITATPYIAKPMAPSQVQRPDDGFVESHDSQAILLGRLNKIYGSGSGPVPQAYKGRVGFIAD
ncbi:MULTISPECIES: type II and III secretion system protein family protein [unclassified Bosea (in: a-proteobacteria)]|uniref:type II and III secretion system protein family protein n=1 Tax=unclassified Bosea (in: a-proteobacteria) TaxID=2653178 RepID=UPI000953F994|nr:MULTISPECIES: type II and III secretion system protein family protein [unclassified Bosea (in: a-proteobacteria)]TAJ30349.1 MAG: type II and III secretion system protein family protein [Bosea sp. (in: a-proteobacteria)]SIQ96926.1 pilus assembly protein CpaC [Bosea sp. TND4EK4]